MQARLSSRILNNMFAMALGITSALEYRAEHPTSNNDPYGLGQGSGPCR